MYLHADCCLVTTPNSYDTAIIEIGLELLVSIENEFLKAEG